jgi:hypothetical protein
VTRLAFRRFFRLPSTFHLPLPLLLLHCWWLAAKNHRAAKSLVALCSVGLLLTVLPQTAARVGRKYRVPFFSGPRCQVVRGASSTLTYWLLGSPPLAVICDSKFPLLVQRCSCQGCDKGWGWPA